MIKIILIIISLLITSCSKDVSIKSEIKEKNLNLQVLEAYKQGIKELEDGYNLVAAKKFNEVEILFPQSKWAPKSSIMAAYAYYSDDYYEDAISELKRFVRVYPLDENLDYVYYLLAMSYYQTIVDEKKDLQSILRAKENFLILKNNYPNTEYSLDAEFKIGLIDDILASKEMYIGRYYFERKKWIASINRFRNVIDNFETTIYTEEALHRLVEIYTLLGLEDEAKKYAYTLGYNYKSSEWYKRSYKIFNENYKLDKLNKIKESKRENLNLFKRIKSFVYSDE